MAAREQRAPHTGTVPSLVVSFDIGTTFSGASYAFLTPGEVPQIHGVTGFVLSLLLTRLNTHIDANLVSYRGQEDQPSSSKVPTVLIYDTEGEAVACGAEACEDILLRDPDYLKVEW